MHFLKGFLKTADMDHNNQGLEFKTSDDSGQSSAAGVAPSGAPAYQPIGKDGPKPEKPNKKRDSVTVAMGKVADASFLDGVGTSSQGASTLVSQLKWDVSGDDVPENMGYNPYKTARSKFILAKKGKRK